MLQSLLDIASLHYLDFVLEYFILCMYRVIIIIRFLSYRMGKLRLSVHRKNELRKKYGGLCRIQVPRNIVNIMTVSIPLDILTFRVSLPRSLFSATPASPLSTLVCERGGTHENPTVQEFYKNTQALWVVNTYCASVRGNCRGVRDSESAIEEKENTPLPKRKRPQKV